MFDPHCTNYPYTEYTDQHYLKIKKNNGLDFGIDYPYIDSSKSFLRKQWWVRLLLNTIVFPSTIFKMGLKIKGRKNIKKYKNVLKNGAITASNHIHMWDYIAVMKAIRPYKPMVPVWANNIRGESSKLVRLVGGIPIPENNFSATLKFVSIINEYLKNNGVLHVYPEGSMWEYYRPIRPFKRGFASFSISSNKPVIPMSFSYRKPSVLRKYLLKQPAAITLNIGEPIYPNNDLLDTEKEIDLTIRVHKAICNLAFIDPKNNIYQPIFNNSKKLEY